jgi:hypothetical protein
VFKKKAEVNCWEDLKYVTGTYISDNSYMNLAKGGLTQFNNKNVFLNKKYAKSALALAQISQLLPYYDTDVYWNILDPKYCICRVKKELAILPFAKHYHILAFNTEDEAERFLKHNEQLVKDFYML